MDLSLPNGLRAHLGTFLASLTCSGLLAWQRAAPAPTAVEVLPVPSAAASPALEGPAASPSPALWQVHVSGAVASPGLVRLPPGARAAEAIAAAGGWVDGADPATVNLAAPVADGQQLHVPALGTALPPPVAAAPQAGLSPAAVGGAALPAAGAAGPGPGGSEALVDLNQAGAAELERLPGVGPALAARILQHRQSHGPYRSPEELLDVPGIGPKTLERFKPLLLLR